MMKSNIGDSGLPFLNPFFLEDERKIFPFRTLDNQCELLLEDHLASLGLVEFDGK